MVSPPERKCHHRQNQSRIDTLLNELLKVAGAYLEGELIDHLGDQKNK